MEAVERKLSPVRRSPKFVLCNFFNFSCVTEKFVHELAGHVSDAGLIKIKRPLTIKLLTLLRSSEASYPQ